ncbi:MAG: hypothetical protein ACYDBV_11150 [Nitrospiria bacterium]
MKIREFEPKDFDSVKRLSVENGMLLPTEGKMFVAEDSKGKVVGFVVLRAVMFIEPFICKNPVIAKKLYDFAEWHIRISEAKIVRVFTKNFKLLKKLGFYKIFPEYEPMEKNFYSKEIKP